MGRPTSDNWNEGAVQMVRTLWAEGLTAGDIASKLATIGVKVSRCAVIGKVHRLGLEKRATPTRPGRVRKQLRQKAQPAVPRLPRVVSEFRRSGAPAKGITSIRFIDREPGQCSMFCEGEDGALGFVCGAPVAVKQWCSNCARLAYEKGREAA